MNLSRLIAKRVVKGWKEYNLVRDEAKLEYYKKMATIYGDLDGLVAGVFESLQPSPPENNKLEIDPKLKENKEISHDVALIVSDDAQISTAVAKKRENKKPFYTVVVENDNVENS